MIAIIFEIFKWSLVVSSVYFIGLFALTTMVIGSFVIFKKAEEIIKKIGIF